MPSRFSPGKGNAIRPRTIYLWMVVPLLAIVLFTGTWTLYTKSFAHAAPISLVPFVGTIPTEIAHSSLIGPADVHTSITLSIGLRLRNTAMLDSYLADIARPKSLNYHRYLTPAQFAGTFSPSVASHNAMLQYLQSSGFTITHTYKNRLLIVFTGTIGLVEQVFHLTINTYAAPQNQTFYANVGDPQLPAALAGQVQSFSGLNNVVHFHHSALTSQTSGTPRNVTPNTANCPSSGSFANGYYTPSQIQAAYNLNGLYTRGMHGEGQTVALFELDGFQLSDVAAYAACYGQSHTSIQTVRIDGGPPAPGANDQGIVEVELDAEVALSTAPKLGTLAVYEAPNTVTGYNAEWAQMLQDVPPVISSSWGLCESDFGPTQVNQENTYFMQAAAQGQSIFVAAGDSGSSGCYFDGSQSTTLEPGDPGGQPFVTSVGGTTLNWNGSTLSETTWNAGSGNTGGASGGGLSLDFTMPAWQSTYLGTVPGLQNAYTNGKREAPDVSLNADPNTGYPVYCSVAAAGCSSGSPWIIVGGTSVAAPMWAAMMALVNEESVKAGGFNIGFANPLLYQIASNSLKYASDFHDVTTGTNDFSNLQSGKYPATAGYDLATGLGSFNADNLATDLVALARTNNGQRLAPASSTWYFPEGDEGGGFQEYITIQNPDPTLTATVNLTYVTATTTKVVVHTVAPSSRQTFDADIDMGTTPTGIRYNAGVIVHVTSGPAVVVERPIYFNWGGVPSGTDIVGATTTSLSYYFSEADTTQSGQTLYKTYIALLNPGLTAAHLTVTYFTGSCNPANCLVEHVTLGAMQRLVVSPTDVGLHQKLAISVVSSDNPFVAERPMYFTDTIARAGGLTTGAASVIGATAPDDDWLFAEGYTAGGFQEYFELANFSGTAASTNIRLEYTDGSTQTKTVIVPAYGFVAFDVNAHQNTHTSSVSAEISASGNSLIVVQRLMYFHYSSAHISGGTDIVGEIGPASHNVYAFAEGYTGGAFQEYLTLQNPTNNNENVAITFFTPSVVFQIQATMLAHSRKTFSINNILNPIGQGAVSLTVQALPTQGVPNPVLVVERPMYFFYRLAGISTLAAGGTDVIGFTSN